MNTMACALTGTNGEQVALKNVAVSAVLRDLLSEVTVEQTYRNDESVNIEAVYTFPLPLDAVLLELEVAIGGRVLNAVVVEKSDAEEQYEDAMEAGDAAVMLQVLEPGLYTVNVGNLQAGEEVTITFNYAMVYRWSGDLLRFHLPTTVAPRYGRSRYLPHQAPEASLTVENQFSLQLDIHGSLRDAQFTCPSHEVKLAQSEDKTVISLQQTRAVMDRDFILNIKAPQAARSFVQCGADGNGTAAVASFQPFFPGLNQPGPLNLAIVIDCSGSMGGDSIEQARQALKGIIDLLQPADRITLIAFGSTTRALSEQLLPCNKANLDAARAFAQQLEADMGGTEIGQALRAAYATVNKTEAADIFLVTDGEVAQWPKVATEARASGHRIFTVGVDSAVSESFLRELAGKTGGQCELVSPREGMTDRVIRHFERMRAPRARRVEIHWPDGALEVVPAKLGAVFEGDTVIAAARFDQPLTGGHVTLEVETEEGEIMRHELPIPAPSSAADDSGLSTVARLAAAARLDGLDDAAGLETALHYRLVSLWTNWLVIDERTENEQARGLPELRKIPQTLAAGWGGAGMVVNNIAFAIPPYIGAADSCSALMAAAESAPPVPDVPEPFRQLVTMLNNDPDQLRLRPQQARDLIRRAGLDGEFHDLFRLAEQLGVTPEAVAIIILAELLSGPLAQYLSEQAREAAAMVQHMARDALRQIAEVRDRGQELMCLVDRNRGGFEVFDDGVLQTFERLARLEELLGGVAQSAATIAS